MYKKLNFPNKLFNTFLLVLTILCFIKLFSSRDSNIIKNVFNLYDKESIIHEDLNGDNKKDTILVKKNDSGLISQIDLNDNKTYSLNYKKDLQTLGEYSDYWPVRVSTLDISRDNSKEIFIQSSFHNKPIQHIFSWNGLGYDDIFCSDNNIVGFVDSSNSKTPKVISGNFVNGNMNFNGYLYNKGTLKEFNSTLTDNLPGSDTINNFICLMESLPNEYLSIPNYFYSQIRGTDLENIFRLANGSNYYKFQDGYFTDLAWDNDGNITCENWILNFRVTSSLDNKKISNITVNLMLNTYADDIYPFKITSVNIY
ncbi:MAG: hypothetical protein RSE41_08845 [Clostridia bacterium]|uniref:hypothetical protein n=1 Tax=Clostridium sp. TaxID=1506 RepID=UPI00305E9F91